MIEFDRIQSAWQRVRNELLAERTPEGHWVGELSSSALSTATAVSALAVVKASGGRHTASGGQQSASGGQQSASGGRQPPDGIADCRLPIADLVDRGIVWLARHQNDDGGFGDTDKSHSNIATTYLVVAAMHLAGKAEAHRELLARAEEYIESKRGIEGLKVRYGIDKTFVVPIMTNLALAGLVKWEEISPLPFELAVVPQSWYRFVGMPVVSYAIPALVAIGQAHYHHKKPWNPITRLARWLSITRSLKVLRRMQPDSGGYLEATPLTSFVVMSLCSPLAPQGDSAAQNHPIAEEVIRDGVKFLANSIRPDGSWPIDTNLATWVTTLSINALAAGGEDVAETLGLKELRDAAERNIAYPTDPYKAFEDALESQSNVFRWLTSCQHRKQHAFTGAEPGGFGWSDLSGAVPDADDTPGAIVALCHIELFPWAWGHARNWLLKLQNSDGGWPTFCRGWGRLPFDRSGTDLTAHAIRAFRTLAGSPEQVWGGKVDGYFQQLYANAVDRGLTFLARKQHPDGSWSPLWFGNQDHPDEDNPVYGTAKVLLAYRDLHLLETPEAQRGLNWLRENQNADGGWGSGVWNKRAAPSDSNRRAGGVSLLIGDAKTGRDAYQGADAPRSPMLHSPLTTHHSPLTSSVEETALAVEALLPVAGREEYRQSVERGLEWLVTAVERGDHRCAAPIGFYFAKLWYYEKLYPIIFTASALGRACQQLRPANS
ncbi:MAG TPA: prenyltransferase/squalene oxidase repeat-containing protein [Pirellulaceae bacterium]|nr:prenyltransferase/squalene oxidase repeat-containing protein [Pirellulaceae bacterium]